MKSRIPFRAPEDTVLSKPPARSTRNHSPGTFLAAIVLLLQALLSGGLLSAQPPRDTTVENVIFRNGEVVLAGTLRLPSGGVAHPAVLLVSGSGPQDRDGAMSTIPGYRPFAAIAEHLARNGIAVLSYDDRGVGESSADYGAATEPDFVKDAEAALRFLLARSDIDAAHVGVAGFSEGGMIAAILAADNPRVAFVISLAGPAVDGMQLLLRQAELSAEAEGMSKERVAEVVREQRRIFELVLAKKWNELEKVVYDTMLNRLKTLPKEKRARVGDLSTFAARRTAQSVRTFQHPRYQFILGHDTSEDWVKVSVPVLALFGELDVQCDAAQNTAALRKALTRGGNEDLTVVVIPSANHLFLKAETGSMSEYSSLPKDLAPGFLDALSSWLRERCAETVRDHPTRGD